MKKRNLKNIYYKIINLFNSKPFLIFELIFMFLVFQLSILVFNQPFKLFYFTFEKGSFLAFLSSIFASLLIIVAYLIIFSKLHNETLDDYGLRKGKNKVEIIYGLIIGLILAISSIFILISITKENLEWQDVPLNFETSSKLIKLLIYAFVFAGIREEIIFRGYLFKKLHQISNGKMHNIIVILISAILFGVLHFGRSPIMNIFIIIHGIVYGTLYHIRNNNIILPIAAHGSYDFILFSLNFLQGLNTPIDF